MSRIKWPIALVIAVGITAAGCAGTGGAWSPPNDHPANPRAGVTEPPRPSDTLAVMELVAPGVGPAAPAPTPAHGGHDAHGGHE